MNPDDTDPEQAPRRDGEETPAPDSAKPTAETSNTVHTVIDSVMAENVFIGVQATHAEQRLRTATGKIPESDITEALATFVTPNCYSIAAAALAEHRMVLLHGPPGAGKRTAALKLVRERIRTPLVSLSPQQHDVATLADRNYTGRGYVIVDLHFETESARADFDLGRLRDKLTAADAYLVITTTTRPQLQSDLLVPVEWRAADPLAVIEAHLSRPLAEQTRVSLRTVLNGATSMRDLTGLAERLGKGMPVEEAVEHLDLTARHTVAAWFDNRPDRRQVAEVTTLAFARGSDPRTFDTMLAQLTSCLNVAVPLPRSTAEVPPETAFPQGRAGLDRPQGLITRESVDSPTGPRSRIDFRMDAYQRHVLEILWNLMEVDFWDGVRAWLDRVNLSTAAQQLMVADGLTALAEADFPEVYDILRRWSGGTRGANGQVTAGMVLQRMAFRDRLAPAALGVASTWMHQNDDARQWVAAMSLTGELGVRYPHDATGQLWRLCGRIYSDAGTITRLFGWLFANLVEAQRNPSILLHFLADRSADSEADRSAPEGMVIGTSAGIAILRARGMDGGSSVARYLEQFDDWTGLVRLMVNVVRYRPTRLDAMEALFRALDALAAQTSRASEYASLLGKRLAEQADFAEVADLRDELAWVAGQFDKPHERTTALLEVLLEALVQTVTPEGTYR
ncbi:hypothetical protein [Nocardia blacklockiae]|uniref:hypothetical protein n=1 Tax=Nocardia blacklockiae TaxID=480036 RepID=UPI0018932638|nr:hypothetical protein [Nocardia blacklockiae]MBF6175692.1 hypothetical protein [Nocardia blacklockiae]